MPLVLSRWLVGGEVLVGDFAEGRSPPFDLLGLLGFGLLGLLGVLLGGLPVGERVGLVGDHTGAELGVPFSRQFEADLRVWPERHHAPLPADLVAIDPIRFIVGLDPEVEAVAWPKTPKSLPPSA